MMSCNVSALSSRVGVSLQKRKGQNKIISEKIDFENVSDVCAYFAQQLSMYTGCSATGVRKFKG